MDKTNIKLSFEGELSFGGKVGKRYDYSFHPNHMDEEWLRQSQLPNGRSDLRDCLKVDESVEAAFAMTYLERYGFVYATMLHFIDQDRGDYTNLYLLLGDNIPTDGKLMAETLLQLRDKLYNYSKGEITKDDADKYVEEKLIDLSKNLVSFSPDTTPFSDNKDAKIAYRIYSEEDTLHKILRFPIQSRYKDHSRILIVPKEHKPEQTEATWVNEDVKRLIYIVWAAKSDVEANKNIVLEGEAFEITYKKNGFVPKKQQKTAFASSTPLYEFDEKTNVITLKSYAESGKKEPFYKRVRFVAKLDGEAEPLKVTKVSVNGGPLHSIANREEKVEKGNGKEVLYYYELANGNSKITLDFAEPYGKVDIKLNTEENLRQGAENCQYESDGRYAYTVVLQPKQKEVNLKVGFGGKFRKGKVSVRVGSDLDEPLSFFEKEGRILVDGGGDKKNNPWIWRIVFLLFGIALGAVGMFFILRPSEPKPAKVRTDMAQVFRGKEIERVKVEKYPAYADYYDKIVSDYSTFHEKVGDSLGTLFATNEAMTSLYKSMDSLYKMDKKNCESFFNANVKGRDTIKLDDLSNGVQQKIGEIDDSWFAGDKKLFANNAQPVKVSAFKSSKGKKFIYDLQNVKDWNAFKRISGSYPELTENNTIWGLFVTRIEAVGANSKLDSLVMNQFKEDKIHFAEIADEVYLISTIDKWQKGELMSEKYKTDFWQELKDKNWAKLGQRKELFLNQKWKEFYETVKNGSKNSRIDSTKDYFNLTLKPSSGSGGEHDGSGVGTR